MSSGRITEAISLLRRQTHLVCDARLRMGTGEFTGPLHDQRRERCPIEMTQRRVELETDRPVVEPYQGV